MSQEIPIGAFEVPPKDEQVSGRQSARSRLWWKAKEYHTRSVELLKLCHELPDNLSPEAEKALWELISNEYGAGR